MSGELLINGVYSPAVGHVVEALMLANAFRNASPDLSITVLLNSRGPCELQACVAHLKIDVVPVDVTEAEDPFAVGELSRLRRDWMFSLTLRDERDVVWPDARLSGFHVRFRTAFTVRYQSMFMGPWPAEFPPFAPASLRFQFDAPRQAWAAGFAGTGTPRVLMLTGSATFQKAPSLMFWSELIDAVGHRFPRAEILLIGSLNARSGATQNISRADLGALMRRFPRCRSLFDFGIVDQLAVAAESSVLVAPHSGMAFAIQCAGTPWVALSGWQNHEYLLNGVPFACIYPTCPRYPCEPHWGPAHRILPECEEITRAGTVPLPCLADSALRARVGEIIEAIDHLHRRTKTYGECLESHLKFLSGRGIKRMFTVSNASVRPFRVAQRRWLAGERRGKD